MQDIITCSSWKIISSGEGPACRLASPPRSRGRARVGVGGGLLASLGALVLTPRPGPPFFRPAGPARPCPARRAPLAGPLQTGLWVWPRRAAVIGRAAVGAWASGDVRLSLAGRGQQPQPTHLHAVSLETKLLWQHSAVTHTPHQKRGPQGALMAPFPLLPGPPAPPDPTRGGEGGGNAHPPGEERRALSREPGVR